MPFIGRCELREAVGGFGCSFLLLFQRSVFKVKLLNYFRDAWLLARVKGSQVSLQLPAAGPGGAALLDAG